MEGASSGLVTAEEWLSNLMKRLRVGVSYSVSDIAGMLGFSHSNPDILLSVLIMRTGSVVDDRILVLEDSPDGVRFRVNLKSCPKAFIRPKHGGYPGKVRGGVTQVYSGMGCIEHSQDQRAKAAYEVFRSYLNDERNSVQPEWESMPDDYREAFVRCVNHLLASRDRISADASHEDPRFLTIDLGSLLGAHTNHGGVDQSRCSAEATVGLMDGSTLHLKGDLALRFDQYLEGRSAS